MVSLELLPAAYGDAIWIEYGDGSQKNCLVIDGGPAPTYEGGLRARIQELPAQSRDVELMVVTHIDADHIDGALILLQELTALNVHIGELWFNGWTQLEKIDAAPGSYAPLQGEFLAGVIESTQELDAVWNCLFDGKPVGIPDAGRLPVVKLPGGAELTMLGPTQTELRRLRSRWPAALRDFSPGDAQEARRRLAERREYRAPAPPAVFAAPQFGDDRSPANGSSISFAFEYEGVAILLPGDAHARSLAASLGRLAEERSVARVRFDAVKMPHHGSMSNATKEWLQLVDCDRWLISTNGDVFRHPNLETIALIAGVRSGPTILCNYEKIAQALEQQAEGRWAVEFPTHAMAGPTGGLLVSLPAAGV